MIFLAFMNALMVYECTDINNPQTKSYLTVTYIDRVRLKSYNTSSKYEVPGKKIGNLKRVKSSQFSMGKTTTCPFKKCKHTHTD